MLENKVLENLKSRPEYFIIQPNYTEQQPEKEGFLCDLSADIFEVKPLEKVETLKKHQMLSTYGIDKKVKSLKPRDIDRHSWTGYGNRDYPVWSNVLLYYRGSNGKYWIFDASIDGTIEKSVRNLEQVLRLCLKRYEPKSKAFDEYSDQTMISCEDSVLGVFEKAVKIHAFFAKELIKWGILQIEV